MQLHPLVVRNSLCRHDLIKRGNKTKRRQEGEEKKKKITEEKEGKENRRKRKDGGKKIKATVVGLELVSNSHRRALPLNHCDEAKKLAVRTAQRVHALGTTCTTVCNLTRNVLCQHKWRAS